MATKDVCKQCGKKDLMLIYCDKCPTPIDLYHPDCLHHDKDSQTRICQECVSGVTSGVVDAPPTIGSDAHRTDNPFEDAGRETNEEHIEEVASHHSSCAPAFHDKVDVFDGHSVPLSAERLVVLDAPRIEGLDEVHALDADHIDVAFAWEIT